ARGRTRPAKPVRRTLPARLARVRAPGGDVSFDLTGQTTGVGGATTGIGRALALGLAQAGADVVATGRRVDMVNEVADAIEGLGRRTLGQPAGRGHTAAPGA